MIRVNFAGASLVDPGSYTDVQVAESSLASPALGVVALVGEADEGSAFSAESGLSAVTFGPDEFQSIVDKFGTGPLVDAAKLAISPSADPQIRGGAQELILIKTNNSTTASLSVPQSASTYGTVSAKRAGASGNNISYECSIVDGKAVITLSRLDSGLAEVSDPIGGNAVLTIECTDEDASAATVTITDTQFKTQLTGASTAQNLTLELKNFNSVKQLVEYISAQPGYTASAASSAMGTQKLEVLDKVTATPILGGASINKDAHEVKEFFAKSAIATFTASIKSGLPTAKAKTYLSGGARGATSGLDVLNGIDELMKRRVNYVVPLFSRNAEDDAADGLTDTDSSYDIVAIHQALAAHCNMGASVKGRKERQGFVGYVASDLSDASEKAADLNSPRVSMHVQKIDAVSASTGLVEEMQPHMLAVVNAAMRASAAPGLPLTFKAPLISGFSTETFDPETQSEKAISANLTFVERAPNGGFRFKLDNSTYASDRDAWIYNRPSILGAADLCAYAIRLNTEQFVGQRNSDITEESIKNLLIGVFDGLRASGVIVGDAKSSGKGYKDLSIKIKGSIVEVGVTLVLVEGLEFILSSIRVQRVG